MTNNLPKIIYGTAWKKEATRDLVVTAVLQGFRAIDTACQPKHYREDLVGEALRVLYDQHGFKREDLWIQTKFTPIGGQDTTQPLPYDPSHPIPSQIRTSLSTSLKNLRTTYLDSLILHSPLSTFVETKVAWKELCRIRDEGVVRAIGLSNTYDVDIVRQLSTEGEGGGRGVEVVQNRWYERNGWDKDVAGYCRENGIMYQSFWTLTGSPRLLQHASVLSLARELNCTPEQIVYRIVQINGVTPLAGSTNKEHMKDGVEVKDIDLANCKGSKHIETLRNLLF